MVAETEEGEELEEEEEEEEEEEKKEEMVVEILRGWSGYGREGGEKEEH